MYEFIIRAHQTHSVLSCIHTVQYVLVESRERLQSPSWAGVDSPKLDLSCVSCLPIEDALEVGRESSKPYSSTTRSLYSYSYYSVSFLFSFLIEHVAKYRSQQAAFLIKPCGHRGLVSSFLPADGIIPVLAFLSRTAFGSPAAHGWSSLIEL